MNSSIENRIAAVVVALTFIPLLAVILFPFYTIAFTGEFVGASLAFGIEEDSSIWTPFYSIHAFLTNLLG